MSWLKKNIWFAASQEIKVYYGKDDKKEEESQKF